METQGYIGITAAHRANSLFEYIRLSSLTYPLNPILQLLARFHRTRMASEAVPVKPQISAAPFNKQSGAPSLYQHIEESKMK
jgi:hypothetical protein